MPRLDRRLGVELVSVPVRRAHRKGRIVWDLPCLTEKPDPALTLDDRNRSFGFQEVPGPRLAFGTRPSYSVAGIRAP